LAQPLEGAAARRDQGVGRDQPAAETQLAVVGGLAVVDGRAAAVEAVAGQRQEQVVVEVVGLVQRPVEAGERERQEAAVLDQLDEPDRPAAQPEDEVAGEAVAEIAQGQLLQGVVGVVEDLAVEPVQLLVEGRVVRQETGLEVGAAAQRLELAAAVAGAQRGLVVVEALPAVAQDADRQVVRGVHPGHAVRPVGVEQHLCARQPGHDLGQLGRVVVEDDPRLAGRQGQVDERRRDDQGEARRRQRQQVLDLVERHEAAGHGGAAPQRVVGQVGVGPGLQLGQEGPAEVEVAPGTAGVPLRGQVGGAVVAAVHRRQTSVS